MSCVYMHENKTNGKVYIGKTDNDVKVRWANGRGYKGCPVFYNAIKKYGWDGFNHIILLDGLSKDQAIEYEQVLIQRYKSTNRKYGYNVAERGVASNGMLGGLATKKIKSLPVCQYDVFGNFIAEYSGINEAAQVCFGRKKGQDIVGVCRGVNTTAHGYVWRYKGDPFDKYKVNPLRTAVDQYTTDGVFIKRFFSLTDAEKESGAAHGDILRCCKGQRSHAKGYVWRRPDDGY